MSTKSLNTCGLNVNGLSINQFLTEEAIEEVYRFQENQYRKNDAKVHYLKYCKANNITPEKDMSELDYKIMVDDFNDNFDANIAENDLWDAVIRDFIKESEGMFDAEQK